MRGDTHRTLTVTQMLSVVWGCGRGGLIEMKKKGWFRRPTQNEGRWVCSRGASAAVGGTGGIPASQSSHPGCSTFSATALGYHLFSLCTDVGNNSRKKLAKYPSPFQSTELDSGEAPFLHFLLEDLNGSSLVFRVGASTNRTPHWEAGCACPPPSMGTIIRGFTPRPAGLPVLPQGETPAVSTRRLCNLGCYFPCTP